MLVNEGAIEKLLELRRQDKFAEIEDQYTGINPIENQPIANQIINESIDAIIEILNDSPTKAKILEVYKRDIIKFDEVASDTEDRETVCVYYSKIREIIGFDSTDDILNDWLYH
jgi:hypothetical protein